MSADFASSFTRGIFVMLRARPAYRRVDNVSSTYRSDGLIHAIMVVSELPPNACFSNMVSLLSRYGMCDLSAGLPFFALVPLAARAVMTLPRVRSDALISGESFIIDEDGFLESIAILSDPARSTMESSALMGVSGESASQRATYMVNTQCERDDCWFMAWLPMNFSFVPEKKHRRIFSGSSQLQIKRFSTAKTSPRHQPTFSPAFGECVVAGFSRSVTRSLYI
ncbi:hypothetical protein ECC02_005728 [Trypanosoma cruzi]|uniref:Uncharacterized protein n=1 Tax=Trypanosoma cruzi TaxID=5693 RepID=A0A7J6Y3H0_TRYCR|nr:hypothetical protein ECC02_005728 [Trypanosoma cruzi]